MASKPTRLTADALRWAANALSQGHLLFTSPTDSTDIDPWWTKTPMRRAVLWQTVARLVDLEEYPERTGEARKGSTEGAGKGDLPR